MGRKKLKVDYLMQYGDEIALLRDGLSLRRVRSRTGRAINTLRKLRTLFVIWILDPPSPIIPNNPQVQSPIYPSPQWPPSPPMHTDATGWALMQPVESHRPTKACRPFSGWCNQTTGWARHHFQKSVGLFERRATRKPVGPSRSKRLKNPKREWCQRGWIN